MKVHEMTIWQNKEATDFLERFRESVVTYFNNVSQPEWRSDEPAESETASQTRSAINLDLERACELVEQTGVAYMMHWSPPPAVGGYQQRIHLLRNLYNLSRFRISPQSTIDVIEWAIGVYTADRAGAKRRTFNPFFWLGRGLRKISRIPFAILEHAGLHGAKFEDSIVGRIFKLMTEAILLLTAAYGLFKLVGKEQVILDLLK